MLPRRSDQVHSRPRSHVCLELTPTELGCLAYSWGCSWGRRDGHKKTRRDGTIVTKACRSTLRSALLLQCWLRYRLILDSKPTFPIFLRVRIKGWSSMGIEPAILCTSKQAQVRLPSKGVFRTKDIRQISVKNASIESKRRLPCHVLR